MPTDKEQTLLLGPTVPPQANDVLISGAVLCAKLTVHEEVTDAWNLLLDGKPCGTIEEKALYGMTVYRKIIP